MQTALVHSELHVRIALGLSVDNKYHLADYVCDKVLESYIAQRNNVSDGFFPNHILLW